MEEDEVKEAFKAYLDKTKAQYYVGRGAGPDFEFEDGSVAEAKGSEWADVGAVLRQIADYYLKRPSVTFVVPADSLNLDRAFRLYVLERVLMSMKRGGKTIRVFLVDKIADGKYKARMFDSFEDLWKSVTERIASGGPSCHAPSNEKLSFISSFSSQEGNELFKLHVISLVNERGFEISL